METHATVSDCAVPRAVFVACHYCGPCRPLDKSSAGPRAKITEFKVCAVKIDRASEASLQARQ